MPNAPNNPYAGFPWRATLGLTLIAMAGIAYAVHTLAQSVTEAVLMMLAAMAAFMIIGFLTRNFGLFRRLVVWVLSGFENLFRRKQKPHKASATFRQAGAHQEDPDSDFDFDPDMFMKRQTRAHHPSDARSQEEKLIALAHHPETPEPERKTAKRILFRNRRRNPRK